MKYLVITIKVLYTATLALAGFAIVVLLMVEKSASENGHGSFSIFNFTNVMLALTYGSLLASRMLADRSDKWLWLGAPAMVLIVGFALFIFISVVFFS